MKNPFARLLALIVIVFATAGVIIFPANAAEPAPLHGVPAYADSTYQVAPAVEAYTQQVCLGLHDDTAAKAASPLAIDYGVLGDALVSHSLTFSQAFNGSINVGRLASWNYTFDRAYVLGTVTYAINADVVSIQATAGSALNLQFRSDTCLFRFPHAYLVVPSRSFAPAVLKDN